MIKVTPTIAVDKVTRVEIVEIPGDDIYEVFSHPDYPAYRTIVGQEPSTYKVMVNNDINAGSVYSMQAAISLMDEIINKVNLCIE